MQECELAHEVYFFILLLVVWGGGWWDDVRFWICKSVNGISATNQIMLGQG